MFSKEEFEDKELRSIVTNFIISVFVFVAGFISGVTFCNNLETKGNTRIVDSLTIENSKLILEINHLDSLKNAEVIEVKSLNNDSTLGLFYKLISE